MSNLFRTVIAEPGVEIRLIQKNTTRIADCTNDIALKRVGTTNRIEYQGGKCLITEDGTENAVELFKHEKKFVRVRNPSFPNEHADRNAFIATNSVRRFNHEAREIRWTRGTVTGAAILMDSHYLAHITDLKAKLPQFPLANRLQMPGTIIDDEIVVESRVSKLIDMSNDERLIVNMELELLSITNKVFEKTEFEVPKDYTEAQTAPDDPLNARPIPVPAGIISKEQMESRINEIKKGAPVLRMSGAGSR